MCYAILCFRQVQSLHIYCDSQYVVDLLPAVTHKPEPLEHWHRDNFDLILPLCEATQGSDFAISIQKIKSHQNPVDLPTLLDKYNAIGNQCADAAAGCLRKVGNPHTCDLRKALDADWSNRDKFTRCALVFLADVQEAKIKQIREKQSALHKGMPRNPTTGRPAERDNWMSSPSEWCVPLSGT